VNDPKSRLDAMPLWAKLLVFPALVPLAVVYSTLAIGFILVLYPCLCMWGYWHYLRFHRKLRRAGRVAQWAEIEGPLKAGRGTLILVDSLTGPLDSAWWVPDSLPSCPEHPLPTYHQWAALDHPANRDLLQRAGPSAKACRERYLAPDRGTAAWVALPPGTLDRVSEEIPESSVVIIRAW
jgi:hypothetical protein